MVSVSSCKRRCGGEHTGRGGRAVAVSGVRGTAGEGDGESGRERERMKGSEKERKTTNCHTEKRNRTQIWPSLPSLPCAASLQLWIGATQQRRGFSSSL